MIRMLLSTGLIIVAFVVTLQFTLPRFGEAESLKNTSIQLDADLAKFADVKASWNEAERKYRSIAVSDIQRLNKILPHNVDNVRLILEVETIARELGLSLENADAGEPFVNVEESDPLGAVSVNFTLAGSYFQLTDFIDRFEGGLRLSDIRSFSFDVPRSVNEGNPDLFSDQIEATFIVDTYWLK